MNAKIIYLVGVFSKIESNLSLYLRFGEKTCRKWRVIIYVNNTANYGSAFRFEYKNDNLWDVKMQTKA